MEPKESAKASSAAKPTESPEATAKPTVKPTEKPTPEPTIEPVEEFVYYKNCSAVRAAGAAPLYEGDPGYSTKLDRDRDGIACE
ncbi:excalibur calcium-binding domain-containing protein [Paenibacillus sp. BIHB 4019]|uniref:excalibur calcium-binding domain-containing protein n=1 Tax=Paenibacillus sp. BIHB 4019 TaxID=1870819 RepID=UPI001F3543F9|nr:excalibur calcium-binding domain-containing protein [Paenibacillus sp. BIHB 4019]